MSSRPQGLCALGVRYAAVWDFVCSCVCCFFLLCFGWAETERAGFSVRCDSPCGGVNNTAKTLCFASDLIFIFSQRCRLSQSQTPQKRHKASSSPMLAAAISPIINSVSSQSEEAQYQANGGGLPACCLRSFKINSRSNPLAFNLAATSWVFIK